MKLSGFICAALAVCLLCSCAKNSKDLPDKGSVTIYTAVAELTEEVSATPQDTAASESTSGSTSESTSENTFWIPSESTSVNISDTAAESGEALPLVESTFALPEDFNLTILQIMDKYQCNQSCNPEAVPCGCQPERKAVTDEAGNIITPSDRVVSIYFMDIETGLEYTLNDSVHYPVASVVKLPFAVYIYQKLDAGEIDPDLLLTYEERHRMKGTGVIINGELGQQYTVAQLLELAITRSDNVAFNMLKDLTTWDDYKAFLKDIGMTHEEDIRKSKQKICVESAGASGRLLARYLTSGAENVEAFKEDLLQTRIKMIRSHYPVYRKYGWADLSFHDIAYVDAPHPYVLAILTNLDGNSSEVLDMFRELSYVFEGVRNPEPAE